MSCFGKKKSINLDISPHCSLKCSACFRQTPDFLKIRDRTRNLSLSEFEKIAEYFDEVEFCGTMGDPTFHPNFHEFLELASLRRLKVRVATAASHRDKDWYERSFKLNPDAQWVFGLDGLPQSSSRYRVNQDGGKLFDVMSMGKKMGVSVIWQFLIFNYNVHEIEAARVLGAKHQILVEFFNTKRGPSNILLPQAEDEKQIVDLFESERFKYLDPKCFNGKKLGHSPLGFIVPCCWYGDQDVEKILPHLCNERTNLRSVKKIEDVFKEPGWEAFEKSLHMTTSVQRPPDICLNKCTAGRENLKRPISLIFD